MKHNCAFDELVDTHKVQPNPENNNRHSIEQIKRLAKIIDYQGQRSPIVISKRTGFIVKGHCRLEAMKELGWEKVAVDFQEYENEAQEYADMTADNEIARWAELDRHAVYTKLEALPEIDIELLGIENFELPVVDVLDPEKDDDVPEVLHDPIARKGDVWLLGNHRVMCGDSTMIDDVEKLMKGEKADMVFTDPPYGVAVNNTMGAIQGDENLDVFIGCLPLLREYSKADSHYYVWCASGDMFPPSIEAYISVLPFQNLLPIRCTHENKRGKKGAFKLNFETCIFGNDNTRPFNPSSKFSVSETTLNDSRYKGDGKLRVYPALWDGERSTEHNMNIVHPTQKKVEMIEFYVEISSSKNEIVMDLFGGSGSTLMACEKQGRKSFNMELDEHYCDVIINRWQQYTGKEAVLESTGETYKSIYERERNN